MQPKLGMGAPLMEQEICPLQHREVDGEHQAVLIRQIMGGYNTRVASMRQRQWCKLSSTYVIALLGKRKCLYCVFKAGSVLS